MKLVQSSQERLLLERQDPRYGRRNGSLDGPVYKLAHLFTALYRRLLLRPIKLFLLCRKIALQPPC